jgi:hypothetical protein
MGLFSDVAERIRKKNQAAEYRRSAKDYVDKGKTIYYKTNGDLQVVVQSVKQMIDEHFLYKKKMIEQLNNELLPISNNFENRWTETKVNDISLGNDNQNISLQNSIFHDLQSNFFPNNPIPNAVDILDFFFGDADEEYWDARQKRDEAKIFYEQMKAEREKMRLIKSQLSNIKNYISDERKMIDSLFTKIEGIVKSLPLSMNNLNKKEINYLIGINKISLILSNLLTVNFLNKEMKVTEEYEKAITNLQMVESKIANLPNIESGLKGLMVLSNALENVVLH